MYCKKRERTTRRLGSHKRRIVLRVYRIYIAGVYLLLLLLLLLPLSPVKQDGAAMFMERLKRAKYAKIGQPSTPPPAAVIPFVIEASSRLGPAAISFLLRICPTQSYLRTKFLNEVSLICARDSERQALQQGP